MEAVQELGLQAPTILLQTLEAGYSQAHCSIHLALAENKYFIPSDTCPNPMSKDPLPHGTITVVRCGPCGKLNPNYEESLVKLLHRKKPPPTLEREIIGIEESPAATNLQKILHRPPPAGRRAKTTRIITIPNLKLRYAEQERQGANQRIADRNTITGFVTAKSAKVVMREVIMRSVSLKTLIILQTLPRRKNMNKTVCRGVGRNGRCVGGRIGRVTVFLCFFLLHTSFGQRKLL